MKQYFFLLLFIVWTFGASVVHHHGNRRSWTTVDSGGKTYVALHILNEPVNLIFPSDKTFAQIAADIKVHSPIENRTCQDKTNTLKFKLAFDDNDKKYIRGEVKVVIVDQVEYVKMYLYEKCGRTEMSYATGTIEGAELSSENTGRLCFKNCDPFRQHGTNTGINVMELKISPGAFECQVFMILPQYVHVEDEKLPQYTKLPLNSSFDGHDEKFWWKSGNDSMLPDQISFDSSENLVINILNSTKDEPYFFRIGSGQPIPTFKFNLVQNNGFSVSTKITSNIDFKGLPSLVFGGKFVSVKVKTPLAIQSLEICELANEPDVPWDHFVLQISPIGDVLECEKAEIVMLNSDMINGAEVLIDRSKIAESINATTESENNSTIASAVTSPKSFVESAEFPWWWIVVGGILYVLNLQVFFKIYFVRFKLIGIIAGIVVFIICIRRRRQQKKKLTPVESIVEDEEVGRITIETKTDVSPEKLSKEMKPKIVGKEKKEKPAKKIVPKEFADAKGNQKPAKLHSIQPSKQQQPPKREPPPPTILPKLLRNLKFRLMYGKDKETKLDEPFDYHENESSTFKPTEIPAKFVQPDLRVFTNFWDCVGEILTTKSVCQVYADNSNDKNTNVYFMVRDLVSNENYLPLRCLSNRMLEDFEPPQKKSPFVDEDGQQRIKIDSYYFLRVFILSYHPLTIEVHCRGPWPHFIFNVDDCPRCIDLLQELETKKWKNSPAACDEDWDTFVCRVKRTPLNSHQFLCYYGGEGVPEPDNPNDINNIFILRGQHGKEWQFDNLRECTRGCFIPTDKSHSLYYDLQTPLKHSPASSE